MVVDQIIYVWPKDKPETSELRAFYDVQQELSVLEGSIFLRLRAYIPEELRARVVQLAHEGHCGIVKAKQRCRDGL